MATKESLAIREEAAGLRIAKAAETLAAQTGTKFEPITLTAKDPLTRSAELAEKTADLLESMVKIVVVDISTDEEEGTDDGDDNAGGSGGDSGESANEPIKRSKTKRSG